MPNLILNQKIKYKGKSYPVNSKGVTVPVPVEKKDIKFFDDAGMIVDAIDDEGKKLYIDDRDKTIEQLKAENKKLQAQLVAKDEIITDLQVQIEELKDGEPDKGDSDSGADSNEGDKQPKGEPLEEKTVDELYEMAGELDIKGRSKLRNDKDELVKAVKEALAEKAGE